MNEFNFLVKLLHNFIEIFLFSIKLTFLMSNNLFNNIIFKLPNNLLTFYKYK
jgi:hypothetical protein